MTKQTATLIFSSLILMLFVWMTFEASQFANLARYFPQYIALLGGVLSLWSVILQIRNIWKQRGVQKKEVLQLMGSLKYIAWIVGYIGLIYIVGFMVATGVFLTTFLMIEAKFNIIRTLTATVVVLLLLTVFSDVMNLYWPTNLLGI